jgi:hypothetical protein
MSPFITILFFIFFIGLILSWISEDDSDDDFSITVTYDCNRVLNERSEASDIIKECLELQDEIKGRGRH